MFFNYALADIYTYQGRTWTFQYVFGEPITTTGLDSTYTHTIAASATNVVHRIVSLNIPSSVGAYSAPTGNRADANWNYRQDAIIQNQTELWYAPNGTTVKVFDKVGAPQSYTMSYIKGIKYISTTDAEIPLPDSFLPALHSLMLSYVLIPFQQMADQEEVNMWTKGMEQLKNLAMYDGLQATNMRLSIN